MFLLDDLVMTTQQRANLKFLVRLGKSSSEALCMLQQVYKEQTSRSTVFKDIEDDVRFVRMIPFTCRNETNVELVRKMVLEDRRLTV